MQSDHDEVTACHVPPAADAPESYGMESNHVKYLVKVTEVSLIPYIVLGVIVIAAILFFVFQK